MKPIFTFVLISFTAINCKNLRFLSFNEIEMDPNFIEAITKELNQLVNSQKAMFLENLFIRKTQKQHYLMELNLQT